MSADELETFNSEIDVNEDDFAEASDDFEGEILEVAPEEVDASELVNLIAEFRNADSVSWQIELQQLATVVGPRTVRDISKAFREERVKNWRHFVSPEEQDLAPSMLTDFVRAMDFSSILSIDQIAASAFETFKATGEQTLEGIIQYGPLANGSRTWEMAENALHRKRHGLTKENCPYGTLEGLVNDKILKMTTQEIVVSMRATSLVTGQKNFQSLIQYGPLANGYRTWEMVAESIEKKTNGLTKKECPYSNMTAFIRARLPKISLEEIMDSAISTFNAKGSRAIRGILRGIITHGALADGVRTWKMIRQNVAHKQWGLTNDNCPYDNFDDLLKGQLLTIKLEDIIQSLKATVKETGKVEFKGKILCGPLADGSRTWHMADKAIKDKTNGLTNDNCPYNSLHYVVQEEILKITTDQIVQSAKETMEEEGELHIRGGKKIMHGPLANNHRTWDMVRGSVERKTNGLTWDNCPYKTLPALLEDKQIRFRANKYRFYSPEPTAA